MFLFQINAVLLNILFIKESSKKMYHSFHKIKILNSTTVFNIDNNEKYLLSCKSAYYYDFWRSCDTEDWSNDAENSALITEINDILTYIQIQNRYLKFKWYLTIFLFLLYFWSNKCSLDEQKRLPSKKILTNPRLLYDPDYIKFRLQVWQVYTLVATKSGSWSKTSWEAVI